MTQSGPSDVLGRWRITEIEGWGADYVDMVGPGYIQLDQTGGQAEFGAMQLGLDCSFTHTSAHFNFHGSDEGTEVSGDGDAELTDDGTLQGELRFHNGDDMPFIARRWRISAAC